MLGPSPRARHIKWGSSQGRYLRNRRSAAREVAVLDQRATKSVPPSPDRSISRLVAPFDERKPAPALGDSPTSPDCPSYNVRGLSSEQSQAPSRTTVEPVRTADLQPRSMQ